jgi:hypothetical protein
MSQQRLDLNCDGLPTSTVHQSRLQLSQPTRRPKDLTRNIETPWGHGTVTGKYGQAHVDFVEAIFRNAEKKRRDDDGGIEIIVDPYKVRMTAGGDKQISWQQMQSLKMDVMRVVIDLRGNSFHRPITGHIIDQITESKLKAVSRPGAINGKERWLWYIKLGPAFVRFVDEDLRLYYDPTPIAALNTGIAQAVARHVATHKNEPQGGWKLDELIKAVGAGATSKAMWERRNELREDAEGLKALGLSVEGDRLLRKAD